MINPGYRFIRFLFKIGNKKPSIYGVENYDSSIPAIFMSNHEKFYGPIIITTRFPIPARTWANSMMTETKACKKYVAESLFMGEMGKSEKFARFYGNILGVIASWTIRCSNPIVAYWDKGRSRKSIRSGLEAILRGENQLMFARRKEFCNNEIMFLPGFLFICKLAASKHNITPKIYPVAINKNNSTIAIGKPTTLNVNLDYDEESIRIKNYLNEKILIGYDNPEDMITSE